MRELQMLMCTQKQDLLGDTSFCTNYIVGRGVEQSLGHTMSFLRVVSKSILSTISAKYQVARYLIKGITN